MNNITSSVHSFNFLLFSLYYFIDLCEISCTMCCCYICYLTNQAHTCINSMRQERKQWGFFSHTSVHRDLRPELLARKTSFLLEFQLYPVSQLWAGVSLQGTGRKDKRRIKHRKKDGHFFHLLHLSGAHFSSLLA